jgi:dihydrodipicolinate synthase/N-acetylneuraminate lyase
LLIETLQNGSEGCISATTNYSISYAASVYGNYIEGRDYSREARNMLGARRAFEGNVLVTAVKGILHMKSGIGNWRNVRPPLTLPEQSILDRIRSELDALD